MAATATATPPAAIIESSDATATFEWPDSSMRDVHQEDLAERICLDMAPDMVVDLDGSIDWLAENSIPPWPEFNEFVNCPVTEDRNVENYPALTPEVYLPRVHYIVSRMKTWPATFARRSMTPFIHRSYLSGIQGGKIKGRSDGSNHFGDSEAVMLDAAGACALYSTHNDENRNAAVRIVRHKAKDLVERRNAALKSPWETLASLQALLLYQIIRLFDGDIRLRAEAEADGTYQGQWSQEILKYLKPLKDSSSTLGRPAEGERSSAVKSMDWQSWVFDESVRRTLFCSYLVQGVYAVLRDGKDPICQRVQNLTFTAQRRLWEAPSEVYWNSTWKREFPYEIRISHWDEDAAGIAIDESDELSVIVMATLKDLDPTAQWIGEENMSTYGLDWKDMGKYLI